MIAGESSRGYSGEQWVTGATQRGAAPLTMPVQRVSRVDCERGAIQAADALARRRLVAGFLWRGSRVALPSHGRQRVRAGASGWRCRPARHASTGQLPTSHCVFSTFDRGGVYGTYRKHIVPGAVLHHCERACWAPSVVGGYGG